MIKRSFIFTIMALLTTVNASYAGCVQTFGVGSTAKGQAEAFTAKADDYSACYYNPAGLTQIKSPTLSATVNFYDAEAKIKNFEINSSMTGNANLNTFGASRMHSTGEPLFTPTMGFAMPIDNNWSFGIAGYSPYGLRVLWDHNPAKNSTALYAWESTYYRTVINPTAAYKVNETLSLGFGVSMGHSVADAGRTLPLNPLTGAPGLTAVKLETEDDFNYSFNAGVLYKPNKDLSMGLTYRSVTNTDFEGDFYVGGKRVAPAEMQYDHPQSVQGGIRYNFTNTLAVETDLVWTNWDINRMQVEKTPMSPTGAIVYDRDWENTVQYKIGTEWKATEAIALRAGYAYDPTPVPEETFDIGWPDTDRSMYTIGLGWTMSEKWSLDTALQYIRSTPMRSISGSSNLNHVYGSLIETYTKMNPSIPDIPADTVNTTMKMEGLMVAYSLTMNYKF
nr:outer membrane protein transport protein [Desulforegula conservatrix]